ncbi:MULTISPECIES: signal peptidase II [Actinomycetes]|uniref:signal peptidase II n=1 Tax=Actinomycetes TaxID=1760 RepID=UPI000A438CC6|nr:MULTISPECIES: signal peptidase II [Actinomycetes]
MTSEKGSRPSSEPRPSNEPTPSPADNPADSTSGNPADSTSGNPADSTSGNPTRPRMWLILLVVAVTVLVADLITKIVAVALIEPGDPVEIIGDTVTFKLVRNSGAAFSMATGYTWILTLIALAVVAGIIRYSHRLGSIWWALGLGLVLGGALGNLIDRIFRAPGPLRGHVVDFMSVGWWPVFNVADSAVVCGAIGLVVLTLFGFEFDGTRSGGAKDADDPAHSDSDTATGSAQSDRQAPDA